MVKMEVLSLLMDLLMNECQKKTAVERKWVVVVVKEQGEGETRRDFPFPFSLFP